MSRFALVVCIAGVCASSLARAAVLEVPLPQLHGTYTVYPSPNSTAEFSVTPMPAGVRSVSIRLSGETNVRQWFCDLDPPFDLPVTLCAAIPDPVTGGGWYVCGRIAWETGSFGVTFPFRPYAPELFGQPTWDFLRMRPGVVELSGGGAPIIDICWPIGELSQATVTGAFLVIDGDFPIPVEPTTWGQIKSLYGE